MNRFLDFKLTGAPPRLSWVVRHHGFGIQEWASRRGHHGVENINRNVLAWASSGH